VTSVLIVDDHPVFLEGLGMLVEAMDGFELAGRCASGEDAMKRLPECDPDVVVLDFQLGDITGLDVLARINESRRRPRVLFLSGRLQSEDVYRLVESGADGVIEKDASFKEIEEAVRRVARGERVLSPRLASAVMAGVRQRREQPPVSLSDRELEIVARLAHGLTAPAIARELGVSVSTIKATLQRIYEKLGVSDRAAAVAEAMRRRLID
jgi:two-component system, NarL family, nitrate/nitrite response regulator NarL